MKTSVFRSVIGAVALTALAVSGAHAQQKDSIKIGFVTFLSGPAAGPLGVPAKMAAEAIVESLNAGKVPAPYQQKGYGGSPLELVITAVIVSATPASVFWSISVTRTQTVLFWV